MQCLFQNGTHWKLIVLDFECRQDEGKHVPNYAVIQKACELCEDKEPAECPTFGKQPWYNFQAYDGYFILDYVNKNPISQVRKFPASFSMGVKYSTWWYILQFCSSWIHTLFCMSLVSMPKCFNIPTLEKGSFSHFLNRKENYEDGANGWAGMPPREFYNPDGMPS